MPRDTDDIIGPEAQYRSIQNTSYLSRACLQPRVNRGIP